MKLHNKAVELLDGAMTALAQEDLLGAGHLLGSDLTALFCEAENRGAGAQLFATVSRHEIFPYLMLDPFTRRAFEKPRGYAGDAVMLDYIYRPNAVTLDGLAKTSHEFTTQGPTGLSIKFRRTLLSAYLTQISTTVKNARILSVASGHCRELDEWKNVNQAIEFVALDQDSESCAHVLDSYGASWLSVKQESVTKLLSQKFVLGTFDFIYSAGLYDYLGDPMAKALTKSLVERLRPGGVLLIANFVPSTDGRAYMELVMQWKLQWRTKENLVAVFPENLQKDISVFLDPHENVAYAIWKKPKYQLVACASAN